MLVALPPPFSLASPILHPSPVGQTGEEEGGAVGEEVTIATGDRMMRNSNGKTITMSTGKRSSGMPPRRGVKLLQVC